VHHKVEPNVQSLHSENIMTVALIGKPNVGKSTLFNRLCGKKSAIVAAIPGTSRDRNVGFANIAGLPLRVVDTGGYDDRGSVHVHVQHQVSCALRDADMVIFVLDGKAGVTASDERIAAWLRKELGKIETTFPGLRKREIVVVANKTEGAHLSDRVLEALSESARLGFGEPIFISASHGEGMAEISHKLMSCAQERGLRLNDERPHSPPLHDRVDPPIQVAIMGRPNVGKSSLLNSILKDSRVISGPMTNLTRDAIMVEWFAMNRHFKLVDTAGLTRISSQNLRLSANADSRKMRLIDSYGKIKRKVPGLGLVNSDEDPSQSSKVISDLSIHSALNALRYSQVVVLTIEGKQGNFTGIDLKLANKCQKEGRAMVVCANKRDLVGLGGVSARQYELGVRAHCDAYLRDFGEIPIVSTTATSASADDAHGNCSNHISAMQKYFRNSSLSYDSVHQPEGIDRLIRAIVRTHDAWSKRIDTSALNSWLNDLHVNTSPPRINGKETRIKFITQVKARPPSFVLFSNCQNIPAAYSRFIKKRLQKDFNFNGVPLRFSVQKSKGNAAIKTLFTRAKNSRVRSKGESRPLGKARDDKYMEIQRKYAQVERRRRSAKMRKTRGKNSRSPGKH